MKLIRELTEAADIIEEGTGAEKQYYVHGVCMQAGIKNRNGRIYPPPVLDREANRYIEEQVKNGSAWGELGHPDTPKLNEDRISHRFTELHKEGNDWIGRAVVCDTRSGRDVIGLIKSGGRIGISTRGLGSLKTEADGTHVVQDDYRLVVGGDIVLNPSAPKAWLDSVYEGAEWWQDERGEWRTGVREVREAVKNCGKIDERKNQQLWEQFIAILAGGAVKIDERTIVAPRNMVVTLAKQANVSVARVRELWEQCDHDVARVKKRLGIK